MAAAFLRQAESLDFARSIAAPKAKLLVELALAHAVSGLVSDVASAYRLVECPLDMLTFAKAAHVLLSRTELLRDVPEDKVTSLEQLDPFAPVTTRPQSSSAHAQRVRPCESKRWMRSGLSPTGAVVVVVDSHAKRDFGSRGGRPLQRSGRGRRAPAQGCLYLDLAARQQVPNARDLALTQVSARAAP
jgi:hypothetical protein